MAINTTRTDDLDVDQDDADLRNNTEPATTHDVVEGSTIGAVGGAIVGGLAGGPIGAVIGAIAGGGASALGVAAVDRHDHDYARTVGTDDRGNNRADYDPAYTASDARIAPEPGGRSYADPNIGPGAGGYDAYGVDYRNHFQTLPYRDSSEYGEYEPAYRYGYDLANDPNYGDAEWDTIEGRARTDWDTRNEGSWDRFKDSVRYGWERVRGRGAVNTGTLGGPARRDDLEDEEVNDFANRPASVR